MTASSMSSSLLPTSTWSSSLLTLSSVSVSRSSLFDVDDDVELDDSESDRGSWIASRLSIESIAAV